MIIKQTSSLLIGNIKFMILDLNVKKEYNDGLDKAYISRNETM